jgi:hypothetical protein
MPDDGYAYDIDQCDVPIERRSALRRFRERRRLWLSWLHTDEHHAIWPTLHGMVWIDVAFRTLIHVALGNDQSALNNQLLDEALFSGHAATQILAIRRLRERTSRKDRISLRGLLTDLKRHVPLFTRENFVCHDGLPYDYEAAREAWFHKNAGKWGQGGIWTPRGGREDAATSESLHLQFDKLAGIRRDKRTRADCLPRRLLETVEMWLDDSEADALAEWSSSYLAHAGAKEWRERTELITLNSGKITDAIKALARAAQAVSLFVYRGGRAGAVMPGAPFDQFEKLDNPVICDRAGQIVAHDHWSLYSAEWDRCVDSVEDELIGRSRGSS